MKMSKVARLWGRSGELLNKILSAIKFSREEVYIANIIKSRPPNNRNPEPDEIQACLPYLIRQIELIRPKIILALGKVAANTLLGNSYHYECTAWQAASLAQYRCDCNLSSCGIASQSELEKTLLGRCTNAPASV
jgi:uracil-DNA glycosylase family 4